MWLLSLCSAILRYVYMRAARIYIEVSGIHRNISSRVNIKRVGSWGVDRQLILAVLRVKGPVSITCTVECEQFCSVMSTGT